MRCVDVNVLVYAHRPESPNHELYRSWLDKARTGHEPLGLADLVCSGFLRIVTHPRVFRDPSPRDVAVEFISALRGSPATTILAPGDRHWDIFLSLCEVVGATGNVVPDAFLGALAIEQGATWVTADRTFARFPGLRCLHPVDT